MDMAKMGRPPLPKAERRARGLRVLITEAEEKQARALADSQGLTLSTWVCHLIRKAIDK